MEHLFVLSWARVRQVARGECCFGVMYCEWYGVCDFVVFCCRFLRYVLTMVV